MDVREIQGGGLRSAREEVSMNELSRAAKLVGEPIGLRESYEHKIIHVRFKDHCDGS